MGRYYSNILTWLLVIIFAGMQYLFSQEITDPEQEYLRIKEMAFSGNLEEAGSAARKLLKEYPSYGDTRVLLARILAWQKEFAEAEAVIDTLLMTEPQNTDALEVKRDISQWSKTKPRVSTDLRAGYAFDYFKVPYSRFWQVFRAGAGHRFNWGTAAAYVNIGNIALGEDPVIHATEPQFEAEAYPVLSKKNYAYLDYAYSPGSYFPTHRAAVELWQALPAGWAVSTGLNYYYFDRNVFIALVSVEKYIRKYWFSGKCYVYFKDNGPTTSFYVNARRYFNDTDYLQLTLGTGTAPDEPFDIQSDLERLSANSIRLAYNFAVSDRLMLRIGGGYSREEYQESMYRDRFEGHINMIYAIKVK
ncbi:MAG TPA: YaiO family outer membrane beta-barrel protein [Bacteroidales bacterium]|nr:YaiO family outer membrane beta-barrel protein [Bacteroidales bacterium]HQH24721.1 YaiO family outer membrane beta-barrel protein [Bacteroidales bacterium]